MSKAKLCWIIAGLAGVWGLIGVMTAAATERYSEAMANWFGFTGVGLLGVAGTAVVAAIVFEES